MARNTARIGRRRRVLNEEVLGNTASADTTFVPGDTPRYGAGANIENHPQVTDLVPRKYRTIALVLGIGLAVGTAAELIAHDAEKLSAAIPAISAAEITSVFADQLIAWTSAAVLLVAAGYAKLVFSLRRHRVDDYRGRYRIWRAAGWAAIALSLNAVVEGHIVVARVLGHLTGWNLLSGNAGWWLATAALFGGWLLLKLMLDAAECRGALATYMLALGCFVVAGASAAGWSPAWTANWPDAMVRVLPLGGNLLLLAGTLLFARYVVLDVQGLIEHRSTSTTQQVSESGVSSVSSDASENEAAQTLSLSGNVSAAAAKSHSDDTTWIDGTEPEPKDGEGRSRRLSKAERKRLRKQKSRNRAA